MTTLLENLKELIPRIKGKWFLGDGALLGLVREGKLIEWDNDIDLYVLPNTTFDLEGSSLKKQQYYVCDKIYNVNNDKCKLNTWLEYMSYIRLLNSDKNLNRSKLMLLAKESYNEKKITPQFTKEHIDIFYLIKDGDRWLCENEGNRIMMEYFTEEELELKENYDLGFKIYIPSKCEQLLERQYGKDWRIPNKDFKYL